MSRGKGYKVIFFYAIVLIMHIFEAIILGAVQGLTEFLPVSSSGHLVLLQRIFGISETEYPSALLFDTMVHAGTLTAVFTVLWKDIWAILKKPVQPLTGYLIIATIPAVIAALLFKDKVEVAFSSGLFFGLPFLGVAFLITALLLVIAELFSRKLIRRKQRRDDMNIFEAVIIGCLQAIAIIPGVSRSGATLSGALSCGLGRDFAARFSFLLSIPTIAGALALQVKNMADGTVSITDATVAPLIAGTLTAAVVGFFSVKLMLKLVREHRLWGFAVYTGILGIPVLLLWK
jgi:undecaprenyl-diphosphatase